MLSTLLIAMFLTGVVAYWGLRYRAPTPQAPGSRPLSRPSMNGVRVGKATPPRYWGVEVIVPEGCCQAAERFKHCRFPLNDAPSLPLAGCDRQCECRLEYLPERRRNAQSYTGPERRDAQAQRAMAERLQAPAPQAAPERRPMAERL